MIHGTRPLSATTVDRTEQHAMLNAGRGSRPDRFAARFDGTPPVLTTAIATLVCYAVLAGLMTGAGLLFTHFLADGSIGHWDDHVNEWFVRQRTSFLDTVSGDFTTLANTLGVAVVAAAVTVFLLFRRWGRLAMLLLIGLAIELAAFLTSNYTVGRPRPTVQPLGSTPSTFSWPSGHSAATFVLYGGIAVLVMTATKRRLPIIAAWTIALALTLGVALSRVYRGEHHPTDVLAGSLLGMCALLSALFVVRVWVAASERRSPPVAATVAAEDNDAVVARAR